MEGSTMKRIDENTVELTKKEQDVYDVFQLMLDEGINIPTATRYAVSAMPRVKAEFVEYLSDGTLTKTKGQIVERAVA
jgi:hypothetical protein